MKYRPLPFIKKLESLPQDEALKIRDLAVAEFTRSPAAQIVASILQSIETAALDEIAQDRSVSWNAGRMAAIKSIRSVLGSLVPSDAPSEQVDTDETEEDFLLYDSPFSFPASGPTE